MSQEITVSQRSRLPCVEVTSAWCSNDRTQSRHPDAKLRQASNDGLSSILGLHLCAPFIVGIDRFF